MTTANTTDITTGSTSTLRGIGLSVLTAGVASAVLNTVISLVAQALGADATRIMGLTPPLYIAFAVIGLLVAAVAWSVVRARAADPAAVLRWLVPVVVLVSLVPDLLVGLAGLGWIGAVALALMHLCVAVAGVSAFRRFLPLPA